MKPIVLIFLFATLTAGPSYGFFKDPEDETIMLQTGDGRTFPKKLGGLQFRERNHLTLAYYNGRIVGAVADEHSLDIVNKYIENPDYHIDNAKKLGFYIGGPLLVTGFYIWRSRKTAKQEPKK